VQECVETPIVSSASHQWKPWGITLTTIFGIIVLFFALLAQFGTAIAFLALHIDMLEQMARQSEINSRDVVASLFKVINLDMVTLMSWLAYGLTTILAVILFVRIRKGSSLREYLCLNRISNRTLGFWVGVVVAFVLILEIVNRVFGVEMGSDIWNKGLFSELMPELEYVPALWMVFAVVVLIAPISEEVFFRGFLMRGFFGVCPSNVRVWVVILITSLMFAGLHLQYSPIVMVEVGALGVIFGLARAKTNSLVTPLAMHGVVNVIAFAEIALSRLP